MKPIKILYLKIYNNIIMIIKILLMKKKKYKYNVIADLN